MLTERYRGFFRSRTRDSFGVALRYLHGLVQAPRRTLEEMAAAVPDGDAQQFQHFIANSPWDHRPVLAQIARDADRVLGGQADSCLIIDESSFPKKGDRSVGVARQWCGRLGKVENCQVAVFAALSDGKRHAFVDARLYLPKAWVDDPQRCRAAGVPEDTIVLRSKTAHALDMVGQARARGLRFAWVGVDGGYGKEPGFLRGLEALGEIFVADVHRTQLVWTEDPHLHRPPAGRRGQRPTRLRATLTPITVEALARGLPAAAWTRLVLRDATRGPLTVDAVARRVWVRDGAEAEAKCWHLIVRRETGAAAKVKYSLCNAPAETPLLRLAQMQGQRFWIERALQDAKSACGLADYQLLGWRAWHHHVAMVMLAMLFILEQRVARQDEVDLLSPADIVGILKAMLPAPDSGPMSVADHLNRRHHRRQAAIRSRLKSANSALLA